MTTEEYRMEQYAHDYYVQHRVPELVDDEYTLFEAMKQAEEEWNNANGY